MFMVFFCTTTSADDKLRAKHHLCKPHTSCPQRAAGLDVADILFSERWRWHCRHTTLLPGAQPVFLWGLLTPNTAPTHPGKTPCLYTATCTAKSRHYQTAVGERRFCLQPRAPTDSVGVGTESHPAQHWPAVGRRSHT